MYLSDDAGRLSGLWDSWGKCVVALLTRRDGGRSEKRKAPRRRQLCGDDLDWVPRSAGVRRPGFWRRVRASGCGPLHRESRLSPLGR